MLGEPRTRVGAPKVFKLEGRPGLLEVGSGCHRLCTSRHVSEFDFEMIIWK